MLPRIGYVTSEPLCCPASLFNLKPEATPAPATDDDTPYFGAQYCPEVTTSHLRAPCAGLPMGRVAHGYAGRCCIYRGQAFSANCLRGTPLATQKWPIPSTKRPGAPHWITPHTLCAVHREADIPGQVWVCAQDCCLWWLTIFPALCPVEVLYPTRKAPDLSGREYLCSTLPEP